MSKSNLDNLDRRILQVLQEDGRVTKVRLAEKVGLSPTPCWERMKRLEKEGYIRGYHADVDVDRIAPRQYYYVDIKLEDYIRDHERFESFVRQSDNVLECHAILSSDYMILVTARSNEEFERIFLEAAKNFKGTATVTTRPIVRAVKARSWQRDLSD